MISPRALAVPLLAAIVAAGCAAPASGGRAPRAVCADEPRGSGSGPQMTGAMARFFLFCVQTQ